MANPTTNFGWQMPTSTDLVTDLPADFEVFGQAVDTALVDLKGGTTDQVLAKNSGTDMDFKWVTAAASGGGKVLQVIYGSTSTQTANSTSTYADTTLSATITPSLSTSKVLVLVSQNGVMKDNNTGVQLRLLRGSTTILNFAGSVGFQNAGGRLDAAASCGYLDSPATTSATTYKTQFASRTNIATAQVQVTGADDTSTMILLEIGA